VVDFVEARKIVEKKDKGMKSKLMSLKDAVKLINDGDLIAIGGCMYSRSPIAALHEIIRQKKSNLTVSKALTSFDGELMLASGCAKGIITSWLSVAVVYGVSKVMRHLVQNRLAAYEEWSHYTMALRFKAGAMGVPFLPTLSLLGSDMIKHTSAKEITCPFTGQKIALVPALFPDVGVIHVHAADEYGNAQIEGYRFCDEDIARASSKVIVTAEKIVSNNKIRREPDKTAVPFFCVDAVVEVPFGSYPGECYGLYEADLKHIAEYAQYGIDKGLEGAKEYIQKYIHGTASHEEFLSTFPLSRLLDRQRTVREILGE